MSVSLEELFDSASRLAAHPKVRKEILLRCGTKLRLLL